MDLEFLNVRSTLRPTAHFLYFSLDPDTLSRLRNLLETGPASIDPSSCMRSKEAQAIRDLLYDELADIPMLQRSFLSGLDLIFWGSPYYGETDSCGLWLTRSIDIYDKDAKYLVFMNNAVLKQIFSTLHLEVVEDSPLEESKVRA